MVNIFSSGAPESYHLLCVDVVVVIMVVVVNVIVVALFVITDHITSSWGQ